MGAFGDEADIRELLEALSVPAYRYARSASHGKIRAVAQLVMAGSAPHEAPRPSPRRGGGAQAPPSPNFQTGMPIFFALSARLAEMPEPGNTSTPIGRTSSISSLRLNGAALAWRVQSGLKAICGTLRVLAHEAAMRSAPFGL